MISVKFKGLDRLISDLKKARKQALPYAIRDTLNTTAFEARKEWQGQVRRTFETRNTFTERAILVDKARGLDPRRMEARVGSVASYAGKIEEGSTRRGKGKSKPIPTNVARIGGQHGKLVRSSSRLRAIQAARGRKGASPQQRNAIALAVARKKKQKYAVLERRNGGRAIFAVRRKLAPSMVWDLSRRSVRVPAHPTLEPALHRLRPRLEGIARDALLRQLRRHHVFGY